MTVELGRGQRAGKQWTDSTVIVKHSGSPWPSLTRNGCVLGAGCRPGKPSMPQSSPRAFVSSGGQRRPTNMASTFPRCTSVRLPAAVTVALVLLSVTTTALGSQGDKEPVYRDCVKQCVRTNCTGARLRGFQSAQPHYMALTGELLLMPLAGEVELT